MKVMMSQEDLRREAMSRGVATSALFAMLGFVMLAPLMTVDTNGTAGEGNLARQIFYFLLLCVAIAASQSTRLPRQFRVPPANILIVLVWCCLSLTWALDPGVAARRLVLTSIIIFSIFLLVERSEYTRVVAAIRYLLPLILLLNYVSVIGFPNWAIHQSATSEDPSIVGAWHGILGHKNFAGPVCAYTVLFFVLDAQNVQRLYRVLVVLGAAFFLYQTHSKTSLGFVAASIVLSMAFRVYNPYYRAVVISFLAMGVVIIGVLAYVNWDYLIAPFSREDFLTGRTQIWPILIEYWKRHWLLGSGYGSFWNIRNQQPIYQFTSGWVSNIASGHNGYLDLLVQIGLPGLMLAVTATVLAPIRTILANLSLNRSRGSLILACIWFSICHNLTESSLFDRDATVQVFLMLSIALLRLETDRPGINAKALVENEVSER